MPILKKLYDYIKKFKTHSTSKTLQGKEKCEKKRGNVEVKKGF